LVPERIMRKATLQNATAPRGRGKSEGGGAIELTSATENEDPDKFDITKPPKSPRRPSQEAPIPLAVFVNVPDTEEFWSKELDNLAAHGFTDRKKNLDLLVKYAIKNSDGTVDKEATVKKVEEQLKLSNNKPQPPLPPVPRLPLNMQDDGAGAETGGNDAVLNMLEQDWADADAGRNEEEDDDDEEDDKVPPMITPPIGIPSGNMETHDADLGEEESDVEEPDSQKRKNKRQSELNL